MDEAGVRVRRHIRAERELFGWNQFDLAEAASVSRRSVQRLEEGMRLGEGKESAVARALGWTIDSIDLIRRGLEPVRADATRIPTFDELVKMPMTEAHRVIQRVRELKGDAAARKFKADMDAYLEATDSEPRVPR